MRYPGSHVPHDAQLPRTGSGRGGRDRTMWSLWPIVAGCAGCAGCADTLIATWVRLFRSEHRVPGAGGARGARGAGGAGRCGAGGSGNHVDVAARWLQQRGCHIDVVRCGGKLPAQVSVATTRMRHCFNGAGYCGYLPPAIRGVSTHNDAIGDEDARNAGRTGLWRPM